jgi:hypothetical protein
MSWRLVALCGVALLGASATCRAAPAITCEAPVVSGTVFAMTCAYPHQSRPLTLVLRGAVDDTQHDLDTATAKPAEVTILDAGKPRQTLKVESDGVSLNGLQNEAFESLDLNFDGYDDLKVWTATSAGPNSGYSYWLYDPAKAAFVRRQDLDDKLSGFEVSVDPKTKTLATSGRDSCCAWSVDTYHWVTGKLMQISDVESGVIDLGDALSDVASIQAFRAATPLFCATRTHFYNDAGLITRDVIETAGDPCEDADDYRKTAKGLDATLNGTKRHGNITDLYRNGLLLQRTIVYDPPRQP